MSGLGMGDFLSYRLCPIISGVVALHGSLNHQAMELFVAYLDCTLFFAVIIILTDCFYPLVACTHGIHNSLLLKLDKEAVEGT
jgi:hypothetical protein